MQAAAQRHLAETEAFQALVALDAQHGAHDNVGGAAWATASRKRKHKHVHANLNSHTSITRTHLGWAC